MGKSDFRALKGVNWQIIVFDDKTTSRTHFETEFLMATGHLRLDSVFAGDKKEIPDANRTTSRNRLHAH